MSLCPTCHYCCGCYFLPGEKTTIKEIRKATGNINLDLFRGMSVAALAQKHGISISEAQHLFDAHVITSTPEVMAALQALTNAESFLARPEIQKARDIQVNFAYRRILQQRRKSAKAGA